MTAQCARAQCDHSRIALIHQDTLREAFLSCKESVLSAVQGEIIFQFGLLEVTKFHGVMVNIGGQDVHDKLGSVGEALSPALAELGLKLGAAHQHNVTLFKGKKHFKRYRVTSEQLEPFQPGAAGFGSQPAAALELCSSTLKEEDSYYTVVASIPLN